MKKVFISGISGGIGTALAKKYLEEGYYVIGQYNTHLPAVFSEKIKADLSVSEERKKLCEYLENNHPDIDVLINNAGADWYGLFTDMSDEEINRITEINMLSVMQITKSVGKNMLYRKKGSVLNISSIWGKIGGSCEAAYSATKGALVSFTKAIAKEWALSGVRCNTISLGFIDTPMNGRFSEEDKKEFCKSVALKRIGIPEEAAAAAYFLTSEQASYITGQVLCVDGGI